jgi:Zn-finger protein
VSAYNDRCVTGLCIHAEQTHPVIKRNEAVCNPLFYLEAKEAGDFIMKMNGSMHVKVTSCELKHLKFSVSVLRVKITPI